MLRGQSNFPVQKRLRAGSVQPREEKVQGESYKHT